MRLELGSPVHCTDGPYGEVADVVVDPARRRVTHLVVQPHRRHRLARLVPIELASSENGERPAVALRCTIEELHRLDAVEKVAYRRLGELPLADPDWDVGLETVLAQPYDSLAFEGYPPPVDPHVSILYDRIPKGEVEIRRASEVVSADGHRLGHVEGFLVDGDDAITHVVLEHGHVFGRREVTIPVADVRRVANDSVVLGLSKADAGALPAVPVHRSPRSRR